jgi:hypothetical protein
MSLQETLQELHDGTSDLLKSWEFAMFTVFDVAKDQRDADPDYPAWLGRVIFHPAKEEVYLDSRMAGISPEEALEMAQDSGLSVIPFHEVGGVFMSIEDLLHFAIVGPSGPLLVIGLMALKAKIEKVVYGDPDEVVE